MTPPHHQVVARAGQRNEPESQQARRGRCCNAAVGFSLLHQACGRQIPSAIRWYPRKFPWLIPRDRRRESSSIRLPAPGSRLTIETSRRQRSATVRIPFGLPFAKTRPSSHTAQRDDGDVLPAKSLPIAARWIPPFFRRECGSRRHELRHCAADRAPACCCGAQLPGRLLAAHVSRQDGSARIAARKQQSSFEALARLEELD